MAKVFVAVAAISLFTGCADVTSDETEEEMQARSQSSQTTDAASTGKKTKSNPSPVPVDPPASEGAPAEVPVYTVHYEAEGCAVPADYTAAESSTMSADKLPMLKAEGKSFNGWYTTVNRKKTLVTNGFTLNKNTTLSAQWKNCKIGDIVTDNGAIITTDCYLNYKEGIIPAGIVCRLAKDGRKMLALGLKESPRDMYWLQGKIKVHAIQGNISLISTRTPVFQQDIDGADNYDEIIKAGGDLSSPDNAFYYAKHYGEDNKLSENLANGWFLPTLEEMYYILHEYMAIQQSYALLGLSEPLFDAGGRNGKVSWCYWTSSYYDYFYPDSLFGQQFIFALDDKNCTELKKVLPHDFEARDKQAAYYCRQSSFKTGGQTMTFVVIKDDRTQANARAIAIHEL